MVERFTDGGNGTVKDNLTKLVWLKNANVFGQGNWKQALSDVNTLASGSAGLTDGSKAGDWRLPNVMELQSLIDFKYHNPALPNASGKGKWGSGDAFIEVQSSAYWSSTTYADSSEFAWYVYLFSGYASIGNKSNTSDAYVWPVRVS